MTAKNGTKPSETELLDALTDTELLAELSALAAELNHVNAERDRLYARRRAVFLAGRRREPQLHTKVMGDAAGISDALVSITLREK